MAAVTVEDCLKIIPNRFELALIASSRAKELSNGASMLYTSAKKEKNTVVALREISKNLLNIENIFKMIEDSLKNKGAFKNMDDASIYETKRNEADMGELGEDLSMSDAEDESFDEDFEDSDLDEDDDEYYKNLDSEVDEDLEDK